MAKHILIIRPSGSGKTYISASLRNQGVNAPDADLVDGLSGWFGAAGKQVTYPENADKEFLDNYEFLWDKNFLSKFLQEQENDIYLFGMSGNVFEIIDLFDKVYFLKTSPEILAQRLRHESRENPMGRTDYQLQNALNWAKEIEERAKKLDIEMIDTNQAPEKIFSKISNDTNESKKCVWIGIGSDVQKESNLYAECININKLLSERYGNSVRFSEVEAPHLNFYDLDVPKNNLNEIVLEISKIASDTRRFNLQIKTINYFPFGLFFIDLENIPALSNLHKNIVKTASPLKENCICEDYLQPHRKYNSIQKSMLKLHGNPHVLSQFMPHITLGLVRNQNLQSIQKEIKPILTETMLKVNNIHVVVEENEKRKVIANFDLK